MSPRSLPRKALALALSATLLAAAPALSFAQAAPAAAPTANPTASASKVVLDNTERVLRTIEARRAEFTSDRSALRQFINAEFETLFDREYSARRVLGHHSRGASEADIKLFADALAENLLQQYGSSLLAFNTRLRVSIKAETPLPRNAGVRVSTEFERSDRTKVPVDYFMRRVGNQWRVFDVMFEGVSMVATLNTQFDAELQRKSIRQVATELRAGQVRAKAGD